MLYAQQSLLGSILVFRSPLSLMSTCLLDNFYYILNTFKHFIFLCHSSQLLVHPCSQSTHRRLSKLPLFYSSCPILLRNPVFISSLPCSREGIIHFFPIADTGALGFFWAVWRGCSPVGRDFLPTENIKYGLNLADLTKVIAVCVSYFQKKKAFKHRSKFNSLTHAITKMCFSLFMPWFPPPPLIDTRRSLKCHFEKDD